MSGLYSILVVLLMLNILVGLVRVLRGPTAADRMLAAEMFSTSAVVIVLLLSALTGRQTFVDVALVFALLSALAVVTFVSRTWSAMQARDEGDDQQGERP